MKSWELQSVLISGPISKTNRIGKALDPNNVDTSERSEWRRAPQDLRSLFAPAAAYRAMAAEGADADARLVWRRPLFIAFVIACSAMFMATAQLSIGSVLSAMLYWSYVPAIQCVALFIACRGKAHNVSRSRLVDSYFVSHTPWLLWICGWALLTNWLPTETALAVSNVWLLGGGGAVLVWALWLDWQFFKNACQLSSASALRSLIIQRLISWPVLVWVFGYGSLWPGVLERLPI
jgi:hypothetical protein